MLQVDVALIGGTGIGERLSSLGGRPFVVPTAYGPMRGHTLEHEGMRLAIVRRHSSGHKTPPHMVPYEAIASGLRAIGAKGCISTAAVGALRQDWPIGTLAACTDFIDASGRNTTLFRSEVRHTDFSRPFPLSDKFEGAMNPCVYVCMNGPRYETQVEVSVLRNLGGDVVGMTAASEAIAMREAGIRYGCLAIVTNLACGISKSELSHGEVADAMATHGEAAVTMILDAARRALQ